MVSVFGATPSIATAFSLSVFSNRKE